MLELCLLEPPDEPDGRRRRAGRARARLHRHRQPPLHRPLRVGAALGPALAGGRDPASAAARLLHVRGRAVHPRRPGWSRRATSAATRSTSRSTATRCTCRSPTRWATRSTRRCSRRCWSGRCATRAGPASTWPSRRGSPNAGLGEYARDGEFVTGQLGAHRPQRPRRRRSSTPGHLPPLRLRDGASSEVALTADPPFGTVRERAYRGAGPAARAGRPADVPHRRDARARRGRRRHRDGAR